MVSVWAASPVYSTEQELVKVPATPSETRVQLSKSKSPPGLSEPKSTEPEGSDLEPEAVSVTVTRQVEASSIATGESQSTTVEVERDTSAVTTTCGSWPC